MVVCAAATPIKDLDGSEDEAEVNISGSDETLASAELWSLDQDEQSVIPSQHLAGNTFGCASLRMSRRR